MATVLGGENQQASKTQRDRNRTNQQQSRKRQRENTERLEAKVQQYERQGVAATKEVQQAARQVVEENLLLRQLLRQRGVNDGDVDAFMMRARSGVVANDNRIASVPEVAERMDEEMQHERPFLRGPSYIVPSHQGTLPKAREPEMPQIPSTRNEPTARTGHERLDQSQPPSRDETDCTEAALIIASLRGRGVAEDVRHELGCKASDKCFVKNHLVFSLAD